MAKMVTGSKALERKLAGIPAEVLQALRPALTKSVHEIAADARALAESSQRTGSLVESIEASAPGETTPPFALDGGRRTAGPNEAFVTAGDTDARQGHLVEFGTEERHHKDGTGTMPAEPFLLPAWRLNKARAERRIKKAIRDRQPCSPASSRVLFSCSFSAAPLAVASLQNVTVRSSVGRINLSSLVGSFVPTARALVRSRCSSTPRVSEAVSLGQMH